MGPAAAEAGLARRSSCISAASEQAVAHASRVQAGAALARDGDAEALMRDGGR